MKIWGMLLTLRWFYNKQSMPLADCASLTWKYVSGNDADKNLESKVVKYSHV